MVRKIIAIFLIVAVLVPGDALAARKKKKRASKFPTARSAILWDTASNKHLYVKNIDRRVYPASTTKVMTALLALENLKLDQYVEVSARATGVQPTKLGVRPGEEYKVRDLLYAIMLKSANDAAIVLAEAVSGSHSDFVAKMNARARQLGAKQTQFANAHGLPSKGVQYTTARDMALIFREALKNDFFRQAITFKYRIIYSKDGRRHFLKSHNKALFLGWNKSVYGKTGFTREAQSCFVGHVNRNGKSYIVAVFGCRKRWEDIKFIIERYGQINL